ncbi:MAG: anti-sigma factor [Pseudomonadota bacterium]
MNYATPELLDDLAAGYALGTLRGAARRRYERLLRELPMAQGRLRRWEQDLAPLLQAEVVVPPPSVRAALLRAVAAPVASRRRHWKAWPIAASLAVLGIALALFAAPGQRTAPPPTQIAAVSMPVAAVEEREGPPYRYLAELRLPSSHMGWLLSVSPDRRQISAVAADDLLTLGRRRAELWLKLPDGSMTALGSLPLTRDAVALYDLPDRLRGQAQATFAISLEPDGRERAGIPTAPVLASVPSADAI